MTLRNRRVVARVAAGAVSIVAAFAVAALPAYAEESPVPTESPAPSASATPGDQPTKPGGESPTGTPGEPGTPAPPSTTPGSGPTTAPTPPPGDAPVDPPPPDKVPVDLAVAVPGAKVTVGSVGKSVRIDVDNTGYGTARDVVLKVATSDLSDDIEVDLPGEDQDCQIDGEVSFCAYPDLAPDDTDSYVSLQVTPKEGAKPGPVGTIHVSVTSENPELDPADNKADVALELIGSGPDLTAFAGTVGPVKPGGREQLEHFFFNDGDEPIAGFTATFELPEYARLVETYQGCRYSADHRRATCTAPDAALEPGEGWDLTGTFTVAISKRAPGPRVLGRGSFTVAPILEGSPAARGGGSYAGGRKIGARIAGGDAVEGDNTVAFAVKTKSNPADTVITVPKAEGEAGDTVKVKFRIANRGPADITGFHFVLKAPTGADIDGKPSDPLVDCGPDYGGNLDNREADCYYVRTVPSGKSRTFTIPLVIEAEKVGDDGRAAVEGWSLGGDPNLKNNTAKVVIGPPGSAGGGGGGGVGDDLPLTGASLAGLIGGGAAAVLLGGALYVVTRRRRTAEAAATEDVAAA